MVGPEDARLWQLAAEEGAKTGTEVVSAEFRPFKQFSFRWSSGGSVIQVSDYCDSAPDDALRDLLGYIFAYARLMKARKPGLAGSLTMGQDYMAYIRSDRFLLEKRPLYLRRARNLARRDVGRNRNIFDAVQRLLDCGLLFPSDLDNTYFTWTASANYTRLGYCDQMFRVVAISSVMDDLSVPEYILDRVVYHECLHLRQGYRPFNRRPHDTEFRRQERLFPMYRESELYMRGLPLKGRALRNGRDRRHPFISIAHDIGT
ncbi:MAG: hypothetical protein A3Q59_01410 [Methanomethylophilus alvi]|nr:MAG: hypothetical protein A3Q59_01410 [Methanomethylophilus alvi]